MMNRYIVGIVFFSQLTGFLASTGIACMFLGLHVLGGLVLLLVLPAIVAGAWCCATVEQTVDSLQARMPDSPPLTFGATTGANTGDQA